MSIYYRWGDNDRRFGRFIYSRDGRYRPFGIMLSSRGDDERPCTLRFSGFGRTLIALLPPVLRPAREWVDTSRYEWSKGNPNAGYWDIHCREFGFSISDGSLHVHYGAQTNEWPGTKSKCYFFPWRQWRHIRHSLYDLEGQHFADLPDWGFKNKNGWALKNAIEAACPSATFAFRDYDGEELTAQTRIEEREWLLGEGSFKWMSLFRRPKVRRSLDIRFSGETGKRKGSWKGGTIGHSIDMMSGELHEEAFRRYCAEHDMAFLAIAAAAREGGDVKQAPGEAPQSGGGGTAASPKPSR